MRSTLYSGYPLLPMVLICFYFVASKPQTMYTRLLLLFVFSSSTLCLFAQLTLDVSNFPPIKTYRVSSTNDLGSLPFAG